MRPHLTVKCYQFFRWKIWSNLKFSQHNGMNNIMYYFIIKNRIKRPQLLAKWHDALLQFVYSTLRCLSQNSPPSSILKLLNASLLTMMRFTSKYSLTTRCWCNDPSWHFMRPNPMKYFDFANRIRFILLTPFKRAT